MSSAMRVSPSATSEALCPCMFPIVSITFLIVAVPSSNSWRRIVAASKSARIGVNSLTASTAKAVGSSNLYSAPKAVPGTPSSVMPRTPSIISNSLAMSAISASIWWLSNMPWPDSFMSSLISLRIRPALPGGNFSKKSSRASELRAPFICSIVSITSRCAFTLSANLLISAPVASIVSSNNLNASPCCANVSALNIKPWSAAYVSMDAKRTSLAMLRTYESSLASNPLTNNDSLSAKYPASRYKASICSGIVRPKGSATVPPLCSNVKRACCSSGFKGRRVVL